MHFDKELEEKLATASRLGGLCSLPLALPQELRKGTFHRSNTSAKTSQSSRSPAGLYSETQRRKEGERRTDRGGIPFRLLARLPVNAASRTRDFCSWGEPFTRWLCSSTQGRNQALNLWLRRQAPQPLNYLARALHAGSKAMHSSSPYWVSLNIHFSPFIRLLGR